MPKELGVHLIDLPTNNDNDVHNQYQNRDKF